MSSLASRPECQYNQAKDDSDEDDDEDDDEEGGGGGLGQGAGAQAAGGAESDVSAGSSRRSSPGGDAEFAQKVHRLQSAKQKLRQLQELVAMVQVCCMTTAHEPDVLLELP